MVILGNCSCHLLASLSTLQYLLYFSSCRFFCFFFFSNLFPSLSSLFLPFILLPLFCQTFFRSSFLLPFFPLPLLSSWLCLFSSPCLFPASLPTPLTTLILILHPFLYPFLLQYSFHVFFCVSHLSWVSCILTSCHLLYSRHLTLLLPYFILFYLIYHFSLSLSLLSLSLLSCLPLFLFCLSPFFIFLHLSVSFPLTRFFPVFPFSPHFPSSLHHFPLSLSSFPLPSSPSRFPFPWDVTRRVCSTPRAPGGSGGQG